MGTIAPNRFIPLAEETGFIVPLGRWILEQACKEVAEWRGTGTETPSVSVNLSARQLQNADLLHDVEAALSYSGLEADRLILEITESVLMIDPQRVVHILHAFKDRGIRVAIDDFGTGYSSLSYLRQFPVDILKIDKSFIDPLDDPTGQGATIVESILRLARDLGLSVTAEGVERQTQRDALVTLACDSAQGNLMSGPLGADAARRYLLGAGGTSVTAQRGSQLV